jgi:hypothetical protein
VIVDFNTALLLLIATILGLIFLRQKDCDERIRNAASEGERRMLAAIRITMDYLIQTDDNNDEDRN